MLVQEVFFPTSQDGNYRNIHSFRFGKSRVSKCAIITLVGRGSEFGLFMKFFTFGRLKFTKWTKVRAPKITIKAVLELLHSPKLI